MFFFRLGCFAELKSNLGRWKCDKTCKVSLHQSRKSCLFSLFQITEKAFNKQFVSKNDAAPVEDS